MPWSATTCGSAPSLPDLLYYFDRSSILFRRKKFATAVVSGKIYAAGGGSRTDPVEEYDPDTDIWCVEASCGDGANGGVVFLRVFDVCGFGGF